MMPSTPYRSPGLLHRTVAVLGTAMDFGDNFAGNHCRCSAEADHDLVTDSSSPSFRPMMATSHGVVVVHLNFAYRRGL